MSHDVSKDLLRRKIRKSSHVAVAAITLASDISPITYSILHFKTVHLSVDSTLLGTDAGNPAFCVVTVSR